MLENRIKLFFEKSLQIPVHDQFVFFEQTGIDGIDVSILMKEFSEHFKVDMSKFNEDLYYTSEKDLLNIPKAVYTRWIKGQKKQTFGISHLAQVVNKGEWFDPENF
jgi:hypothetical protein